MIFIYKLSLRSFPGRFGERPHKRSAGKSTSVQFFLLSRSSERTPKPSEELALLHAGLGRRTVNVPEGASHNEVLCVTGFKMSVGFYFRDFWYSYLSGLNSHIIDLLCEVYPKLHDLDRAWMVHKAMGKSI